MFYKIPSFRKEACSLDTKPLSTLRQVVVVINMFVGKNWHGHRIPIYYTFDPILLENLQGSGLSRNYRLREKVVVRTP